MVENIGPGVAAILVIVMLIAIIKGAVKTFQRNWIAALLLLLLLTPIWLVWAFIEVFTGDIQAKQAQPSSNHQNVNVTLINQADGTTRRIDTNQADYPQVIDAQVVRDEPQFSRATLSIPDGDTRECPFCAETIKRNAIICRYCNRDL